MGSLNLPEVRCVVVVRINKTQQNSPRLSESRENINQRTHHSQRLLPVDLPHLNAFTQLLLETDTNSNLEEMGHSGGYQFPFKKIETLPTIVGQ